MFDYLSSVQYTSLVYEGRTYSVRSKIEAEAYKKLGELKASLERGDIVLNNCSTVRRWAQEWLETYKKTTVSPKQYLNYTGLVRNYINPAVGNMRLKDVRDVYLQRILNEAAQGDEDRKKAPVGHWHLLKLRNTMKEMFHRAVKAKLIRDNPAEELILPDGAEGSYRSITPEERKAMLEVAESHYAGLWIKTLLFCGLRPGETVPLQWKNVDFDKKMIHISTALESGSKDNFKDPKSRAGIRDIPIQGSLLADLLAAKRGPFDFLFTQPATGKHHTTSSLRCYWNNFKRALDIHMGAKIYRSQIVESVVADDLVPYCLRHTFCTDLQDAGVPLNVAKYLMGHADVTVTANIYTETAETALADAADRINTYADKVASENPKNIAQHRLRGIKAASKWQVHN